MKFLQIGLGSMGKRRVRCIHALRVGETIGFDLRADRRAEAESLYGIRTVATFEEGMAADPDAILISTPPDQHVEYCLAAIAAGKPFFAEETVMLESESVTPVLEALERRPVLAAPSCTMRFHPAVTQIRAALQDGEIGRPLAFTAQSLSYLPDWHPWERVQDFYVASRVSGGGREMVIFDLDWIEWLFGNLTTVVAEISKASQIPADIDDVFHLLGRFDGGLSGSFTSSVAFRVPGRSLEVACENGQIIWDSRGHRVMVYSGADGKWQHTMETASREHSYDRMYIEEIEHFLQAVRGEVTYIRDFHDVKRMLEVLCAVERSAAEGRRIALV
jgi:predicted dehydrogenase